MILIDNIIVSYPTPKATLTPTGIDSDGTGFAKIGRVGAFTEPFLSRGLEGVTPRMTYSAETNDAPPCVTDWGVEVTGADFVWRWHYLNQAYGPWTTNKMQKVGDRLIGDTPMTVTNRIGDIEYYYIADVVGSWYKFHDFARDVDDQKPFPGAATGSARLRYPDTTVSGETNYWSRIREGVSPWQEMHLEAIVFTNLSARAAVTNDWTMELVGDHSWRGFVHTPTNYAGCVANIRFIGKNMWESNGVTPFVSSRTNYFPIGEITEIPMGGIAGTNCVKGLDGEYEEQDVPIDATSGYLVFEFNDQSRAFTVNRAEYQDFNKWTPSAGQGENRYIGNFVNTSYVGQAKMEYTLDMGAWPMSESTSSLWGENFDINANSDHLINVPFGLNKRTPNGWVADNGMFVNSQFSAKDVTTVDNRALQLQGRGLGTLSLVNCQSRPYGIGTVSFTARLAQYMDFNDFYYCYEGFSRTNYAISAKAVLTHNTKAYCDASTGSPSLSLIAYYSAKGCYEFRITRASAEKEDDLWGKGTMRLDIYKWYKKYDPATGSVWNSTNLTTKTVTLDYSLVPTGSTTNDNQNWGSVYFAAHSSFAETKNNKDLYDVYLEGGVSTSPSANGVLDEIKSDQKMRVVSFTDKDHDSSFARGTYGVGACDCPAAFGNIQIHNLTTNTAYKADDEAKAGSGIETCNEIEEIENSIMTDDGWGCITDRIVKFGHVSITNKTYDTEYKYGVAAAPVKQKLFLSFSPYGQPLSWEPALELSLDNFSTNQLVFAPHTIESVNLQISTGGDQWSPRTDVVVDDIKFSQWAADSSDNTLGRVDQWAFTDGWVSRIAGDIYQGAGSPTQDIVAVDKDCGYRMVQLNDTEYVYIFTNTFGKAVSFLPKQDMTIKEMFILGGGGGGGPGGGGGGGGGAIWVTNSVECIADEASLTVCVGKGGSGGGSALDMKPADSAKGGDSAVTIGEDIEYVGYGGGAGGMFTKNEGDGGESKKAGGGGSARDSALTAGGGEDYASGNGGAAEKGAPGGGGGGGLRGVGDGGGNTPLSNGRSAIWAGTNGCDGVDGYGGMGGDGFPISALGETEFRYEIAKLLSGKESKNTDIWFGGGGGGGTGEYTNKNWSVGQSGAGGKGGGGQGGYYTSVAGGSPTGTYENPDFAQGANGAPCTGGGGGGGSYCNPAESGSKTNSWIIGGGSGGSGLVAIRVKIKDRFTILQPMRGETGKPMSIRTPFLNGISLLSFSWKDADSNAVLKVQVATNGVNSSNIKNITEDLDVTGLWSDFGEPIRFADMDDATRTKGSTNILIGFRAPIGGIVRLLADPDVVKEARKDSNVTNDLKSMYGSVVITGMKVLDEPELDDRSWWGWNIMPTYRLEWSSLYDPVTLGPGRSCGLNFSGVLSKDDKWKEDKPDYDPEFADDPQSTYYHYHDPFIQTPRFTNRIGAVMFKARVLETNLSQSGWITISGCADPGETNDVNWCVLTNIEVTADTTVFEPFLWRLPGKVSSYQALRLSAFGAAEGRYHSEYSGQPFGDSAVSNNPTPIQRVLIDEVLVTQPMAPRVEFLNAYPFRRGTDHNRIIENIDSPDQQPLLGESFGLQVQVLPAGMEEELDVESIKVYMAWHVGETPWGHENWCDDDYKEKNKVELKRAEGWSSVNLVYRSHPNDADAFIPPQIAGDNLYQVVQYHIWAEFSNKNGIEQDPCELTSSWKHPKWYRFLSGNEFNNMYDSFSAYTVLDSISPGRAWINEINMYDGNLLDAKNQYVEVAVPQGYDVTGWSLQSIRHNNTNEVRVAAYFGLGKDGGVSSKTADATNSYAFIALQSPSTKAANTHSGLNDGTWLPSAFDGGVVDVTLPHSLLLVRPTGMIEHQAVFMCTNTDTSRVSYEYDGTNFQKLLEVPYPGTIYAGADAYAGSLGVYTNNGESVSSWTNTMMQTPGKVNLMADGTPQYIDPGFFDPPRGSNLWIYANIDYGSLNSLKIVQGGVTNTSIVMMVPQSDDGTFSTSIVYEVSKWFEMDSVKTNEFNRPAGDMNGISGRKGVWTLDLANLKISDSESRKFYVTAYARDSMEISKHIEKTDPYYPAVVDWLKDYDEGEIKLSEFWGSAHGPCMVDGKAKLLTLKQMYWLNIPPVSEKPDEFVDSSEWVVKGYMSGEGAYPVNYLTNVFTGAAMTNVRVAVTMMISNRLTNAARAPDMLRGIEPGSTSSNYNEHTSANWDSVTFNITGRLITDNSTNIRRPLRWFTFGPESFTNFTREIEIADPFSNTSPGYSYGWYKYQGCTIGYGWSLKDDTNRPPITVQQLNGENAVIGPIE